MEEVKNINGEEMKSQLDNASDIVTTAHQAVDVLEENLCGEAVCPTVTGRSGVLHGQELPAAPDFADNRCRGFFRAGCRAAAIGTTGISGGGTMPGPETKSPARVLPHENARHSDDANDFRYPFPSGPDFGRSNAPQLAYRMVDSHRVICTTAT